jgi:8-oxo-dGTP diphosphatase
MTDFPVSSTRYMHKVRVRVCGILERDNSILLIRHEGLGPNGYLWAPPGGGVEFGISAEETLVREFKEETHLDIAISDYLFTHEYINEKHHALELFYKVIYLGGKLALGMDPEVPQEEQILSEVRFISFEEIAKIPKANLHNSFSFCSTPSEIFQMRGFYKFEKI